MHHPRNVRDAVPGNLRRSYVRSLAGKVSEELGYKAGDRLLPIFERLGGTYHNIASAFGVYGDRIFVDSLGSFAYEGDEYIDHDVFGMAEAIGCYIMHYPLTRMRYGEDVRMGISRYGGDAERTVVVKEGIWFAIELTMPHQAFREAVEQGMDLPDLSRRFRVTTRSARSRKQSLGLAAPDP